MKATIYINGTIGEDVLLLDVIRQFKSFEEPTEVEVQIDSVGGSVDEGEAIFNYLKGLDKTTPVTTVTGKAYSIAAQIFMSGSTRIVEDKADVAMIHCPWIEEVSGDAEELEWYAAELRTLEDKFSKFYADTLEIDKDAVKSLLDQTTYMSGTEAKEIGFATELKTTSLQAVAMVKKKTIVNKKDNEMAKGAKEKKTLAQKVLGALAKALEIKAELTLQDTSGEEIVFPALDEGDIPAVGDTATMGGTAIADGSYIMENATYVFVDGALTEIVEEEPAEEPEAATEPEATEPVQALAKATRTKLKAIVKAEEIQQISTWAINSSNTSFAVGETVAYYDEWDEIERPVGSGEFQLMDGSRIVTDATGVIVSVKAATSAEGVVLEEQAKAREEEVNALKAQLVAKEKEVAELRAKSSPEIVTKATQKKQAVEKDNSIKAMRYFNKLNN